MPNAEPLRVAAVLLAAGSSTRMGRNKLLLELDGQTVVRRAVRAAIDGGVDRVVVVLGHEADLVRAQLDGLPCEVVVNPDHARGVGTSLHAGIRHAAGADAVVVLLADMPFVDGGMIRGVVDRFRSTGARLVLSHYGDVQAPPELSVQAPPTLYARELFEEVLAEPDERCGKRIAKRHGGEAEIAQWPASSLRDIDVAADYDDVRSEIGASRRAP
jgi:molybdenum cofactor cytidylyltransferase